MGDIITNFVEISAADDDNVSTNEDPIDIDSTPDNEDDNDVQGPDNSIDNEQGDEDDHDPAPVTVVQEFDLALIKTINGATPGPYYPGSMVTFDIEVFNQGGLDAYDIQINDYIPTGLTLSDTDWSLSGSTATMVNEIPVIAVDDSETVTITFTIDASFQGSAIINDAEIAFATAIDNSGVNTVDEDSEVNNNSGDLSELGTTVEGVTYPGTNNEYDDERPSAPGTMDDANDSDDYDPELIIVTQEVDLALRKLYTRFTGFRQ